MSGPEAADLRQRELVVNANFRQAKQNGPDITPGPHANSKRRLEVDFRS